MNILLEDAKRVHEYFYTLIYNYVPYNSHYNISNNVIYAPLYIIEALKMYYYYTSCYNGMYYTKDAINYEGVKIKENYRNFLTYQSVDGLFPTYYEINLAPLIDAKSNSAVIINFIPTEILFNDIVNLNITKHGLY